MTGLRRLVPFLLVPLALIAGALASAPWLRPFPSDVISVPLFGAVLLSTVAPVVVVGIGVRRLWLSAVIDVALFVFFELLVTLREPGGFGDLYDGLMHGPAKVLSYALPLVSPRTLLVAPVALCWLGGTIVGECLARGWRTLVPYVTLLVVFGLSYGGSVRAVSDAGNGRRYDTLLAGALIVTLLLLRAAETWIAQDESAEATQPGGLLPLRGLSIGALLALVVGLGAAGVVQASAFDGPARTAARTPPIDRTDPLTPLSFISGLRPADPTDKGRPVFTMTTTRPGANYVSVADVDYYDGDGWSFQRTFRPSGGVVPADTDTTLRSAATPETEQYTIADGPLTGSPWMPYLYRPKKVSGVGVDVDVTSGMIVPSHRLGAGTTYDVSSTVATTPFARLSPNTSAGAFSVAAQQLPGGVETAVGALTDALAAETGVPPASPIAFLQALARDFRTNYGLAGAPTPSGANSASPTVPSSSASSSASSHPAASASTTPENERRAGGTSFADVLASIRQFRSASPEQYATLMALVARKVGVPARVATGFRIPTPPGRSTLPPGRYPVTTAEAWTWVEVPIAGQGWVTLDPSPSTYSAERPPRNAGSTPSSTPSPSPTKNAQITQGNNGHAVAPRSRIPHKRGTRASSVVLVVGIIVVALLVLVTAFLLLRKRWRIARRRRGPARQRLLGAWRETLDMLEEAGLPPLRAATGREVADAVQGRFGVEPARSARQLAEAANVAIFRPAATMSDADADAAWQTNTVLTRMVRRGLRRRDRLRMAVRYHRPGSDRLAAGPDSWADIHGYPIGDTLRHRRVHR